MRGASRRIAYCVGIILAIAHVAVAAVVPASIAIIIVGEHAANRSGTPAINYSIAMYAVAFAFIAIKFVAPLLIALSPSTERGNVPLVLIWLAAIAASTLIISIVGFETIPHLGRLNLSRSMAVVAIWVCIEILGTIAFPALIAHSRGTTIPDDEVDHRPSTGDVAVVVPSAPPAKLPPPISADAVHAWLSATAAADVASRSLAVIVEPDKSLRTTHRRLADVLQLTKSNCARRLVQLERRGKISVCSNREGTWIRMIDGDHGSGGSPTQKQPTSSPPSPQDRDE